MARLILNRLLLIIPFLFVLSVFSFVIIQLPPGDIIDVYVRHLEDIGGQVNDAQVAALKARYGLDQPLVVQYVRWMGQVLQGDFGTTLSLGANVSLGGGQPVVGILVERVPRTVFLAVSAILLTWLIAVPIGVLSAVRQYSIWDHAFTAFSFIGLAVPGFLMALVLMYLVYTSTGFLVSGFNSPEFRGAPFSIDKVIDTLKNVWLPILIIALTHVAGVSRVLRASLLDELKKQYVTTARSKGLKEWRVILRYPVRIAINPLISTLGWTLPAAIGGEVVVSTVLNIPTMGPLLLHAILAQDMFLTGAMFLILGALTVLGTLLSDILLVVTDPRIRYGAVTQ